MNYDNNLSLLNSFDNLQRPIISRINEIAYNYKYDSSNNILQIQVSDNFHKDLRFSYDASGRIATANGPWGNFNYSYDVNDNIIKIVNQNKKFVNNDKYFTYDKSNHLVGISSDIDNKLINSSLWKYDKSGFLISDYDNNFSYDLDGNLWKLNGKNKEYYDYDAFNLRTIKYTKEGEVITIFSKSGQELYEFNVTDETVKKFVYLNDKKVLQVNTKKISADNKNSKNLQEEIYYFFNDNSGSPLIIFDKDGKIKWREIYLPFGERFISSENKSDEEQSNKHWFAGKEQDATGLSYFGARYYNPSIGRFLTPDPVGVLADNPHSFNRYIYANNNPYKYKDPDGRLPVPVVGALMGAGTGLVSSLAAGERDIRIIGKSTLIGAGVGFISTFAGSSVLASTIMGGVTNAGGDIALKTWTEKNNQITNSSVLRAFVIGATGGLVVNWLGKIIVPNRNLPAANATSTNYVKQTMRQLAHNDSEVLDSVRRSMHSTIQGGIFGATIGGVDSYLSSSFYSFSFCRNDNEADKMSYNK